MSHTTNGTPASGPSTPEQIEADIARQRDELADTVDAIHHKLDVKARAQDKVADLRAQATTDTGKPRPAVVAVAVGVVALAVGGLVLRRRRA
jgi:LPXTG-motif cell wall-anchored protein